MGGSHELFQLIKSLSKAEKRYFKLFASTYSRGGEGSAVKLFNILDRQKTFCAAKLLAKCRSEALARNIASHKYNLQQLLLRSLQSMRAGNTAEALLRDQIEHIQILYERGCLAQARKLLKKARKLALSSNDPLSLQYLQQTERLLRPRSELPVNTGRDSCSGSQLAEGLQGCATVAQLYELLDQMQSFAYARFHTLSKAGLSRGIRLRAESLCQLQGHSNSRSGIQQMRQCALLLARIQYFDAVNQQDELEAQKHVQSLMRFWSAITAESENLVQLMAAEYVSDSITSINAQMRVHNYATARQTIGQLRALKGLNHIVARRAYFALLDIELVMCLNVGQLRTAQLLLKHVEHEVRLGSLGISLGRFISLSYNIAVLYFVLGENVKALQWCGQASAHSRRNQRIDICNSARIMELMLHCELGNLDLAESQIRSIKRSKQASTAPEFERIEAIDAALKCQTLYTATQMSGRDRTSHLCSADSVHSCLTRSGLRDMSAVGSAEFFLWQESRRRQVPILRVYYESLTVMSRKNLLRINV